MKEQKMPLGLYIHIPFCAQKCAYCDFYSLPHAEGKMDEYVRAVSAHLAEVAPAPHSTLWIPSISAAAHRLISVPNVSRHSFHPCKKHYVLSKDAEITLEANPDSAGDWRALRTLRRAGFNRISLGMQSLHRRRAARCGPDPYFRAGARGGGCRTESQIQNVSLDLIYGLPEQTMESFFRLPARCRGAGAGAYLLLWSQTGRGNASLYRPEYFFRCGR